MVLRYIRCRYNPPVVDQAMRENPLWWLVSADGWRERNLAGDRTVTEDRLKGCDAGLLHVTAALVHQRSQRKMVGALTDTLFEVARRVRLSPARFPRFRLGRHREFPPQRRAQSRHGQNHGGSKTHAGQEQDWVCVYHSGCFRICFEGLQRRNKDICLWYCLAVFEQFRALSYATPTLLVDKCAESRKIRRLLDVQCLLSCTGELFC